jgi:hypothetical protein
MNASDIKVEELKTDHVFLETLKNKKSEAISQKNIIKLYEVLDNYLFLSRDEDQKTIDEIYSVILDKAIDNLTYKLESNQMFSFEDEEEHMTLRAIYEYAIEHYSSNSFSEARELFLMLSILTENNNFRGAMQIHAVATIKKLSFDDFLDQFVDIEQIKKIDETGDETKNSYFILYFYDNANQFLHENKQLLTEALQRAKRL